MGNLNRPKDTYQYPENVHFTAGWNQGVAWAVAQLIRLGHLEIARDLWNSDRGCNLRGVDPGDASAIRPYLEEWRVYRQRMKRAAQKNI